jgi:2-amino-1-hydroxyethylphosphonate dioxygenase (glycine-forming)
MNVSIADTCNEIMQLYQQYGSEEYAGEDVSQLEHMAQAAQIATQQGFDEEFVLAAFLHDIGHICVSAQAAGSMGNYGIAEHEKAGAGFLQRRGFSGRIIALVGSHVAAKRYLTFRYPEYYEQLSEASKQTLQYQGGQMSDDEAMLFEHDPLFEEFIEMRRIDELAKETNKPLPPMEHFREMMIRHLEQQAASIVKRT